MKGNEDVLSNSNSIEKSMTYWVKLLIHDERRKFYFETNCHFFLMGNFRLSMKGRHNTFP